MCEHSGKIWSNNQCAECGIDRNARYRRRRRLAMSLLHAAEARGLSGVEALSLLQNADYWTLQECQSAGIR